MIKAETLVTRSSFKTPHLFTGNEVTKFHTLAHTYIPLAWIPYLTSISTPPASLIDFPTPVGNRERKCKLMELNDVAMFVIAIANLIVRLWEMRKGRRRNTDGPDQTATWFRIRQLGRASQPGSTSLIKPQILVTQSNFIHRLARVSLYSLRKDHRLKLCWSTKTKPRREICGV